MKVYQAGLVGVLVWFAGLPGFSVEISFQQGDLEKDHVNITGSYDPEITYIRSSAPSANEDDHPYAYVGTTSTTDFRHLLMGFDLSYLQTIVGSNTYLVDSVELRLTKYNDSVGTGTSSFDLHETAAFDETAVTWDSSGATGDLLSSIPLDTTSTGGTVFVFSGAGLVDAVSAVVDNETTTLFLRAKRRVEGSAGNYSVLVHGDSSGTLDARPELIVNVAIFPEPIDVPSGPTGQEVNSLIGGAGLSLSGAPVDSSAPVIAMMSQTSRAGEILVGTGTGLADITYYYAPNGALPLVASQSSQFILNNADNRSAVILPTNEVCDGTTLVFAEKDGLVSRPFRINGPEVFWSSPASVRRIDGDTSGNTLSIYGKNLSVLGESSVMYLSGPSHSGFITNLSGCVENRLQYQLPDDLAAGDYKVWAHNGTGKSYGWSEPLTFSVYNSGTSGTARSVLIPDSDPAINWTNIQSRLDLGGVVELQDGAYVIDRPLVISNHYTKLIGSGRGSASGFDYESGAVTPSAGMTVIRYDYTHCLDEVIRVVADNVDISRVFLMNGHDGGSDAHQIIEIQGKSCSMRFLRLALYDERNWGAGGPPRDWSSIANDPNSEATGATNAYIDDGCVFFNYDGEARGRVYECDFYTINTGVRIGTLQNSDLTTNAIDPAVSQVVVEACDFHGQYAGEACRQTNSYGSGRAVGVVIYNGKEIEICGNYFESADREQGRLLNRSVLSYNSSTRDLYIADNVTFDCGSADWAKMPDNQGEQYLFHYRYTKGGIFDVTSSTDTSVTIITNVPAVDPITNVKGTIDYRQRWRAYAQHGGWVPDEVGDNDHWVAFIVSGTGVGQYRQITNMTRSGSTATFELDASWRLPPDSTSRINLFVPMRHIIVYNNEVDCGDVAGTKTHMVSLWNDCVDNVVRGNSGKNLSAGVTVNGCLWAPSAWNLVEDNVFSNMYLFAGTDLTAVTNAFVAFQFATTRESEASNTIWSTAGWYGVGNIARYNTGTGAGCGGIMANAYYGETYGHTDVWEDPGENLVGRGMQLCVMEKNSFDDIEHGVFADCSTHYGIVYDNDFSVSSNNIIEYRPGHEGPVNTQVIVRDNLIP